VITATSCPRRANSVAQCQPTTWFRAFSRFTCICRKQNPHRFSVIAFCVSANDSAPAIAKHLRSHTSVACEQNPSMHNVCRAVSSIVTFLLAGLQTSAEASNKIHSFGCGISFSYQFGGPMPAPRNDTASGQPADHDSSGSQMSNVPFLSQKRFAYHSSMSQTSIFARDDSADRDGFHEERHSLLPLATV